MFFFILIFAICGWVSGIQNNQLSKDTSVQLLSELPLEKLLKLKTSLQEFAGIGYANTSIPQQEAIWGGAHAMALHSRTPIKRGDYEDDIKKTDYGHGKISSIFSLSVTTLAFLAFGGYLLCLIVQAVKYKSGYNTPGTQPTFVVSAGIKKRPQSQTQFASYGRRKRQDSEADDLGRWRSGQDPGVHSLGGYLEDPGVRGLGSRRKKKDSEGYNLEDRRDEEDAMVKRAEDIMEEDEEMKMRNLGPSPEELYGALLRLCEGYSKWDRLNLGVL